MLDGKDMLRTPNGKSVFSEKKIRFMTAHDLINALNRSNNSDCSIRACQFLI